MIQIFFCFFIARSKSRRGEENAISNKQHLAKFFFFLLGHTKNFSLNHIYYIQQQKSNISNTVFLLLFDLVTILEYIR